MEFRRGQLRYFITVAEEGQMTRAAARLHIAQPALSQSIANLEAELGFRLLDREPRGVRLTAAGEVFLEKARSAVAAEEEADSAARALARAAGGMLEIGFVGPPPTMAMPELMDSFSRECPRASISYSDLPYPRGRTAAWLADVDVAVAVEPALEPAVVSVVLRQEPRAVVMPTSHPLAGRGEVSVADVIGDVFISYHPDVQRGWCGLHCLDDHRGGPPRELTQDRVETTMDMVVALGVGRGIAAIPRLDSRFAAGLLPGSVAAVLGDAAPAKISLLTLRDGDNPLAAEFVEFAAAHPASE